MDNFYARTVFFVKDAERSLTFYTERLGFSLDWNYECEGRAWVFQVGLFGFALILNQVAEDTRIRAGHGRLFIGLDDNQRDAFLQHIGIRASKPQSTTGESPRS
jgi:catechol 2,3-dioxygenase-like lactoylglutathione lyase family enzyme